jgi:putative ABC transport system permease protein
VAAQFLTESLVPAALGEVAGVMIGCAFTVGLSRQRGRVVLIPADALWGGLGVALVVGAVAALYPALRAAGLPPAEPVRTV